MILYIETDFEIVGSIEPDDEFDDSILKQWVETIFETIPNAKVNVLGNLGKDYDLSKFDNKEGEITRADVIDGLKTGTSNKQLSLHLQNLCDIIKPIKATIIETGEELNVNEYVKCNGK